MMSRTDLGEAPRRALAARVAAAEGAVLTSGAYAALEEPTTPHAAPAAEAVVRAVAAFSAVCDGVFRDFGLSATLRDRRIPLAEQLGRLGAALENARPPEPPAGVAALSLQIALADLRLTLHSLEEAVHGLQPTPMGSNAGPANGPP